MSDSAIYYGYFSIRYLAHIYLVQEPLIRVLLFSFTGTMLVVSSILTMALK